MLGEVQEPKSLLVGQQEDWSLSSGIEEGSDIHNFRPLTHSAYLMMKKALLPSLLVLIFFAVLLCS